MSSNVSGGMLRVVTFTVPGTIRVNTLKFFGGRAAIGTSMALYSSTYLKDGVETQTNHPTKRLVMVGTSDFELGQDGW